MKQLRALTKRLFLPVLMAAALSGCVGDRYTESLPAADGYVTVTFALEVPGSGPATRLTQAEKEAREEAIVNFDVLIFDGTYNTFVAHAKGTIDGSPQLFQAELQKGTGYRLVVLANLVGRVCYDTPTGTQTGKDVKDYVAYYTSTTTPALTNKDNMLAGLIFSDADGFGLTTSPAGGGFSKFPMWGEEANVTVSDHTPSLPVQMLRAVARIDVRIADAIKDDFTIKEAYLYNYSTRGLAAPLAASYTPSTQNPDTSPNADITALSLPADTEGPGTIAYQGIGGNIYLKWETTSGEFVSGIYVLEAPATTTYGSTTATALVIGGCYGGISNTTGKVTYYRADLKNDRTGDYIDILRNYCYQLKIINVERPGKETPDEAFEMPIAIETEITLWIDGESKEIICD